MSSYPCPRCGKAILDSPGGPHEAHWCTPKEILDAITKK